jgi:glycosyltransferase involved in cell wall biosynthesis
MKSRPHIHYHTDCDFFGGSENMIATFLNDEQIHRHFEVSFSYRVSERYETGLRKRIGTRIDGERYPLLSDNALLKLAASAPKLVRAAVRLLNFLLLFRYWAVVWNIFVLYKEWRNRNIALLHINNGGYPGAASCQSAVMAARLAGIDRVVMVVNNIAPPNRYWLKWLDFPLNRAVAKVTTIFVTGSRFAGLALQSVLNLADHQAISLHNGIASRPINETRTETRNRLGLANDITVFGVVALLEFRKGHHVLLEAVAALREVIVLDKMPIVLIEGEGAERQALQALAEKLSIGRWIRFVGTERNIFDFMRAVDVMVLPSIASEDFPNVVLEAMSVGKPVIASRIAGTPEQIEDGVTGWLVEPGDSSSLALKMAFFIEEKTRVASMGAQARLRFEENFTARSAVSRYVDLYKSLLNKRDT